MFSVWKEHNIRINSSKPLILIYQCKYPVVFHLYEVQGMNYRQPTVNLKTLHPTLRRSMIFTNKKKSVDSKKKLNPLCNYYHDTIMYSFLSLFACQVRGYWRFVNRNTNTNISCCYWDIGKNMMIDWLLVFNATFSNISAISVLVVEEAGVPGENHRPWASNW